MFLHTRTNQAFFLSESHLRKTVCACTHLTKCLSHAWHIHSDMIFFPLGKSQTLIHIMHTALLDCFLNTGYTKKPHSLRIQRLRQATEDLGWLVRSPCLYQSLDLDLACVWCRVLLAVYHFKTCSKNQDFKILFIYYGYMCGYLVPRHMYGGQRTTYHMSPRGWIQVFRIASKHLYLMSHFMGSKTRFFFKDKKINYVF